MAQFAIDEILTTGIAISGFIFDVSNSIGVNNYVLTSTSSGVMWQQNSSNTDLAALSGQIIATGALLNNRINSLSGYANNTFLSGSGVANYVARWSNTKELITGSIYDLGTGVGIGTTSPSAKFNVYGGNTIFRNDVVGGASAVFIRNWASNPSTSLTFGNNPNDDSSTTLDLTANVFSITNYGDPGSYIRFGTRNDTTSDIRLTIDPSGRVGVGVINPSTLLVVGGAGSATALSGISFGEDSSANLYRISTARLQTDGNLTIGGQGGLATALTLNRSSTSNENGISFSTAGSTDWYFYVDNGNNNLQIQRSSEIDSGPRVRFDGANSNILFNLGSGNVGIGTSQPEGRLHVSGANQFVLFLKQGVTGSQGGVYFENADGFANASARLHFVSGDSILFTRGPNNLAWAVSQNANVGIGVTNPTTLLQLKGDAGSHQIFSINRSGSTTPAVYIGTDGNQNALIASNNTNLLFGKDFIGTFNEYARISSNGNFGIGTSNPNTKLHIENSGTVSSIATVRLVGSTGNNAGSQIEFYKAQNPKASIGLASAVTGGLSDDLLLLSSNPNSIVLTAGSSGLAVFKPDGKVGIGMYNPISLLSIGGTGSTSPVSGITFGLDGQANLYRSAEGTVKTDGSLIIGTDLYVADELGVGVPIANKRFNYGAEVEVANASIQLVLGRLGNATGQGGIGADATNTFAVWNVSGGIAKQFVISQQGNVGIGTDTPSSRLSVSGAIESLNDNGGEGGQLILRGNTYRYSVDNFFGQGLRFFREDDATTANGIVLMQITSGGNVGINTSAPGYKLEVVGNASFTKEVYFQNQSFAYFYGRTGSANKGNILFNNGSAQNLVFGEISNNIYSFGPGNSGAAPTSNTLTLDNANISVGIGTSAPTYQLTVIGANQATANLTDAGAKGGSILVASSVNASNQGGAVLFATKNDVNLYTPQFAIKSLFQNGIGSGIGDLAFSSRLATGDASLTEVLRIKYDGKVGIGTTNPTQKLEVSGTVKIQSLGVYSDPTDNAAFLNYDTNGGIFTLSARSNAGNTYMAFRTSNGGTGSEKVRITNDGNLGIQTSSPLAPLHVGLGGDWPSSTGSSAMVFIKQNTANAGLVIQEPGDSNFDRALNLYTNASVGTIEATYRDTGPYPHLAFRTSGTERVRIASNGLVGISSNVPTDFLDFGGAGKNIVFGYAAYGEVLNSAASIIGNNVKASPTAFSQVRRFANATDQGNFIKLIYNKGVTFHTNITSALNTDISEDTNERMRINLSGDVGIGAINPIYRLQLQANNPTNGVLAQFYNYNAGALGANGAFTIWTQYGIADWFIGQPSGVNALTFGRDKTSSATGVEYMRINSAGNIGIGIDNPSVKLAVNGEASFGDGSKLTLIGLDINSGATPSFIKIRTKIPFASAAADFTINIKGFRYNSAETTNLSICWHYYLSTFYNPSISSAGSFAPTVKLSAEDWDSSGTPKVCIVLVGPGYWPKLYVESMYSSAYNDEYADGWDWVDADATGTGNNLAILSYKSNFGNNFLMLNNGYVGIGSANPTQRLDVGGYVMAGEGLYRTSTYGTNGGAWISFGDTGVLDSLGRIGAYGALFNINSINGDTSFQYNGSEKMRITTAGNVGIGVTNPGVRLQVVNTGSITSTSTVRIIGATGNGGGSQIEFFKGTSQKFSIGTASAITGGFSDDLLLTTLNPSSIILTAGLSGLAIFKTDGKVGIGMYNPTTLLSVGSAGSTTAASGITFGSDPEVNLYRSAENVLKTDGSLIITDSLGVGLSPTQKLQVDGLVGNPALNGTSQSGIFRISNTTDNAVLDFGIRAGGLGAWIQSTDETSLDAYYPLLLNPNGARVGVGLTTNISGILHVRTPAAGDQTLLVLEHSAGYANGTENRIDFFDDEPHKIAARIAQYYSTDSNNRWGLKFYTNPSAAINPTPALTLRGNNNVGIGTTSPIERLHVSGNIHVQAESNSIGGNGIYLGDVTNRYLAIRQTSTNKDFAFDTYNNTESWVNRLTILNNGGNVGINSTAPNTKLRVNGSFSQRASGTPAIQEYKNIVTFSLDGNGDGGYVVKTPFRLGSTYEMVILHVKGYGYGIATFYDFKVVFYDYAPSHAPVNYSIIDLGNDGSPKYLAKDADNYVQVCFGNPADTNNYFYRFTVDCITTRQGNDYSQGWAMYQTASANFGFASTGVYQLNSPVNFRTTNYVGIGTTNPQNRLSVIGAVNIGSNNFNTTAPTNGLIVEGNVGIGISSPAAYINADATSFRPNPSGKFLDVYSSANEANINLITNNSGDGSGIGGLYFTRARGQADNHYQIAAIKAVQGGTNGLIAGGKLYFYTKSNGGATLATAPAMTIATDSNVGIGTTVPNSILELYKVPATSGTLQPMLTITSDYPSAITTNFGSSIVFKGRTAGNELQDNAQISAYNENNNDNGYALGFYTRPTVAAGLLQRLTILRGGNVGIGTTSPSAKLQINNGGDSRLIVYETGIAPYTATLELSSQVLGTYGGTVQYTSDTETLTIQNYGRTATNSLIGSILFRTKINNTTATDVVTINGFNGNVGIGTTTPSFKLTVQGITQARGGVYVTQASPTNTLVLNADNTALHKIYTNSTIDLSLGTNFSDTQVYLKNGGNVGVGQNNPIEKLHVQGNVYATDGNLFNFKAQRIPIEGSPQGGTYKGYLILAKAYTSGFVEASYVIGKVILRRGTSGTGHNLDIYQINSSRGYNLEIFQVSRFGAIGTRFLRLVKVTYGGVVYHAIETSSGGGAPSTEMHFEGSIVDSPLILTDETFVSNVTAFGDIAIFVDQSSNVGIGTATPGNKLDVIGSSYLSGIVYVGLAGHTTNAHGIVFGGDSEANIYRAATDTIKTDGNLIVAGNVTAANLVSGSGTSNYVTKWNGTKSITNSQIFDDGTYVGINTASNTTYRLQVNGSFAATTKSFDITHPTISGKRLVYASLEGPENGVYFRGRNNNNEINLPHYWSGLVHDDSITVDLTSAGKRKDGRIRNYSVDQIGHNKVYIYTDSDDNIYDYYYTIFAERKDVCRLITERDME